MQILRLARRGNDPVYARVYTRYPERLRRRRRRRPEWERRLLCTLFIVLDIQNVYYCGLLLRDYCRHRCVLFAGKANVV